MSEKWKEQGGAAFPCMAPENIHPAAETGMSLRDWFAGQALIATYLNGFAGPEPDDRARRCYQMADAMLRAREDKT